MKKQFKVIFDYAPVGMIMLDEYANILQINDALCFILIKKQSRFMEEGLEIVLVVLLVMRTKEDVDIQRNVNNVI